MIALNRSLRALEQAHGVQLRISYGKVAEYQRRGVVHFHALIRLDRVDPAAPDAVLAPPSDITAADLAALVADAVQRTVFRTPDYADTSHSWLIRWGRQLDIRPLGLPGDEITAEAVAGYLAKYATKATEPSGLPVTGRMTEATAEQYSNPDTHLGRLIAFAYELGTRPEDWTTEQQRKDWRDTWGRLRRWTHMLAFGGHFATKSRRYSTTHKTLRTDRRTWRRTQQQEWRRRHQLDDDTDDDETTVDRLRPDSGRASAGTRPPTAQLSAQAAARARAYRALAREERSTCMTSARNRQPHETTRGAMNALLHTVEETAEILRISRWKVFALIRTNELRSVKIGGSRRIPRRSIEEYLERLLEGSALMPTERKRRRRANGRGSIYQRASDGKWVGSAYVYTTKGVRKRRPVYGNSFDEVREKLDKLKGDSGQRSPAAGPARPGAGLPELLAPGGRGGEAS
jgi:excisionase family DNA binding protein